MMKVRQRGILGVVRLFFFKTYNPRKSSFARFPGFNNPGLLAEIDELLGLEPVPSETWTENGRRNISPFVVTQNHIIVRLLNHSGQRLRSRIYVLACLDAADNVFKKTIINSGRIFDSFLLHIFSLCLLVVYCRKIDGKISVNFKPQKD